MALGILIIGMLLIVTPQLVQSDSKLMQIVEHLGLVFAPAGLMALVYEVMSAPHVSG